MDAHLLDAVADGATRRIVRDGHELLRCDRPSSHHRGNPLALAWGRFRTRLDRLDRYLIAGLPVVAALPGWVYGDGSWFRERVIQPVMAGRRVLQIGKPGRWVSPIHVHDCARALMHLAEHGEAGRRYFLVNSDPIRMQEFAGMFARLANRPLRVWRVPAVVTRVVVGQVLADDLLADAVFSNIRLRGTGFRFEYPTVDLGLQQIIGARHA